MPQILITGCETSEISTRKESQEEETNTCDLFIHVTLEVLLNIQFIHDRYLNLLHFVI